MVPQLLPIQTCCIESGRGTTAAITDSVRMCCTDSGQQYRDVVLSRSVVPQLAAVHLKLDALLARPSSPP
eukprot:3023073-Rhodomonas_salina.1